ncbi:MAG: tRNA glutamyl-Q(34) synthetase GluQRS [Verrucomicrobiales bacterium]
MTVTRFAPSPTGRLHMGHALAALVAWDEAQQNRGTFLLRIEDIDAARSRIEWEQGIEEDLRWLGLRWPAPVRRQSEHLDHYRAALDRIEALGLLYPCFCTRAEIAREIAAAADAPQGPEGPHYPGTCRHLDIAERARRFDQGGSFAWRLDSAKAAAMAGPLSWKDRAHGDFVVNAGALGDVVLARKDIATSYHLAVVVDDAAQGITLVTRGEDLLRCTHLHRILQHLLDLPVPQWHHHRLLHDDAGKRLAKRNDALSLKTLRESGVSPAQVRQQCGFE